MVRKVSEMRKSLFLGYNLLGIGIVVLISYLSYFSFIKDINDIFIFLPMMVLSLSFLLMYKRVTKQTTISDIVVSVISLEVFSALIYIYQKVNAEFFISQANVSNVFIYGITNMCLLLVLIENKFQKSKTLTKVFEAFEVTIVVVGFIISVTNCFIKIIY